MKGAHKALVGLFLSTILVGILIYGLSIYRFSNRVHFSILDVGQGSATLIGTPSGHDMLIDTGANRQVLRELSLYHYFWDRELSFLVLSHPDQDHIGGTVELLRRYQVNNTLMTDRVSDSELSRAVDQAVDVEPQHTRYIVGAGDKVDMATDVSVEVLWPRKDSTVKNRNDSSIVLRVVHGDNSMLVMGDVGVEVEGSLVDMYGRGLRSDILVVGHHGSKTSTSQVFIDTVKPRFAVISSGDDNRYGHPHQSVIDTLEQSGVMIVRTDTDGAIDFVSDGQELLLQ